MLPYFQTSSHLTRVFALPALVFSFFYFSANYSKEEKGNVVKQGKQPVLDVFFFVLIGSTFVSSERRRRKTKGSALQTNPADAVSFILI